MKRRSFGIDPGYANLGLGVIEEEDGHIKILETRTISLGQSGNSAAYGRWPEQAWKHIDELYREYHFTEAATEAPPVVDNLKQTMMHWYATGAIWMALWRIAELRPKVIAAKRLKSDVAQILGLKVTPTWNPDKAMVGGVVQHITGAQGRTNHDNDAVMIAVSAFHRKLLPGYKEAWKTQAPPKPRQPIAPRIQL